MIVRPTIPLKTLVRDKFKPLRIGVLVSYGTRAARVQYAKGKGTEWIRFPNLAPVTQEELMQVLETAAEDLV